MAILHASIFSQALKRTVPIEVILPADKVVAYGQQREAKRFKTLYLLHGLLGSCEDWTRNTNIRQLAEERDLAVVMRRALNGGIRRAAQRAEIPRDLRLHRRPLGRGTRL